MVSNQLPASFEVNKLTDGGLPYLFVDEVAHQLVCDMFTGNSPIHSGCQFNVGTSGSVFNINVPGGLGTTFNVNVSPGTGFQILGIGSVTFDASGNGTFTNNVTFNNQLLSNGVLICDNAQNITGATFNATLNQAYSAGGTQVVGTRKGGWTAPTGTAQRATFATDTVTLINLARAVKALIDDLTTHGLIGT